MSIGPFDPAAGVYGSLNYTDPFKDTTADPVEPAAPQSEYDFSRFDFSPEQVEMFSQTKVTPFNQDAYVQHPDGYYIPKVMVSNQGRSLDSVVNQAKQGWGVDLNKDLIDVNAFESASNPRSYTDNLIYEQALRDLPVGSSPDDLKEMREKLSLVRGTYNETAPEPVDFQEAATGYLQNFQALPSNYSLGELSTALGGSGAVEIDPELRLDNRAKTKYGIDLNDSQYQQYNAILKDIVIKQVAQNPDDRYDIALEKVLRTSPEVAALNAAFGLESGAGTRSTGDGSRYVKDPLTGEERRTLEVKDPTLLDSAFQAAAIGLSFAGMPVAAAFTAGAGSARQDGSIGDIAKSAAGAYLGGQAAGGSGMFANVGKAVTSNATLASAISAGTASGVTTAVQGGDLGDVVKSGLLGGVGGYLNGVANEAAMLQDATNAALEVGDSFTALQYADEARKLAAQSDLVSTIANSAKAVDAITSGDYASALASGMQAAGTNLTEFTSNQLTGMFGEEAFANLNIDDVAAGVNKVATSLAEGKDIEEALKKGVTTYVQQGGSLGEAGDQVRDYLESAGGALYENVIKPAGNMLTGLLDNVSSFDTPEGIKAIEDAVKKAGVVVDDKVLQPIKEGAESIYEPLETPEAVKAIEDVAKVAGSATEDAVRATGSAADDVVIQPVRETLKDIDSPDINGPDIDLPNVNLPNVNLPSVSLPDVNLPDVDVPSVSAPNINIDLGGMFDSLMSYLPSQQQQRRAVVPQQTTAPVLADLSNLYMEPTAPEELLATRDYLSELLRTI